MKERNGALNIEWTNSLLPGAQIENFTMVDANTLLVATKGNEKNSLFLDKRCKTSGLSEGSWSKSIKDFGSLIDIHVVDRCVFTFYKRGNIVVDDLRNIGKYAVKRDEINDPNMKQRGASIRIQHIHNHEYLFTYADANHNRLGQIRNLYTPSTGDKVSKDKLLQLKTSELHFPVHPSILYYGANKYALLSNSKRDETLRNTLFCYDAERWNESNNKKNFSFHGNNLPFLFSEVDMKPFIPFESDAIPRFEKNDTTQTITMLGFQDSLDNL